MSTPSIVDSKSGSNFNRNSGMGAVGTIMELRSMMLRCIKKRSHGLETVLLHNPYNVAVHCYYHSAVDALPYIRASIDNHVLKASMITIGPSVSTPMLAIFDRCSFDDADHIFHHIPHFAVMLASHLTRPTALVVLLSPGAGLASTMVR